MRLSEGGGMAYKKLKPAVVIEVGDGEVGFAGAEAAHIVGDDGRCAEVGKVRPPDIGGGGEHVELRLGIEDDGLCRSGVGTEREGGDCRTKEVFHGVHPLAPRNAP